MVTVITTSIDSRVNRWLNQTAKQNRITKRRIIESAIQKYRIDYEREQLKQNFDRAAKDYEMIALAEEGLDDYLEQLENL